MYGGVAAMRLCFIGAALIPPRAVTATRPLPGAKIETCRSAAAWRSAPFLLLLDLMGIRVAATRLCPLIYALDYPGL